MYLIEFMDHSTDAAVDACLYLNWCGCCCIIMFVRVRVKILIMIVNLQTMLCKKEKQYGPKAAVCSVEFIYMKTFSSNHDCVVDGQPQYNKICCFVTRDNFERFCFFVH